MMLMGRLQTIAVGLMIVSGTPYLTQKNLVWCPRNCDRHRHSTSRSKAFSSTRDERQRNGLVGPRPRAERRGFC
jgi:hypothetical protein